ncbi:hypothetical protein OC844_005588, partial [Tilletia horrida]
KQVLKESLVMIPDTQTRLTAAISELDLLLVSIQYPSPQHTRPRADLLNVIGQEQLDDSNRDAAEATAAREALEKAAQAQAQAQSRVQEAAA